MTTQVELITTSNQSIIFEFIENDFTEEFIEHFRFVKETFQLKTFKERIPYGRFKWDPDLIKFNQDKIIAAVNILNDLDLNFPIPVEEIKLTNDSAGRQLLNQLHRFFTTSHDSRNCWQYNTPWTFKLQYSDSEEFARQVHNINDAVHAVECYYTNDRVKNFDVKYEYQLLFDSSNPIDPANNPQWRYFQHLDEEYFQYFTDQLEYDIWLPLHQIQGKNYWICYFDEDDPTHWDVSTNIIYSGSIAIGDRSAARDPKILSWLESYGITPGPMHCGMPLGKIITGRDLVPALDEGSIKDIIINE
jgi:hypothetical protein